ncbi:hypothetical protein Pelo_1074 [Pelomyxa schiedti]|nr:hypothetical protein Pelo_1074 [Pelomyxa schiedti]
MLGNKKAADRAQSRRSFANKKRNTNHRRHQQQQQQPSTTSGTAATQLNGQTGSASHTAGSSTTANPDAVTGENARTGERGANSAGVEAVDSHEENDSSEEEDDDDDDEGEEEDRRDFGPRAIVDNSVRYGVEKTAKELREEVIYMREIEGIDEERDARENTAAVVAALQKAKSKQRPHKNKDGIQIIHTPTATSSSSPSSHAPPPRDIVRTILQQEQAEATRQQMASLETVLALDTSKLSSQSQHCTTTNQGASARNTHQHQTSSTDSDSLLDELLSSV